MLTRLRLALARWRILRYVKRNPGADVERVSDHFGWYPMWTSDRVDELLQAGRVVRRA